MEQRLEKGMVLRAIESLEPLTDQGLLTRQKFRQQVESLKAKLGTLNFPGSSGTR